ncbi:MAG: hypothetical protein ACKOGL_05005, partial [Acidimicrobiaceae bacterium]
FNAQCIASGHQSRACSTKSVGEAELGQISSSELKKSEGNRVATVSILSVTLSIEFENSIGDEGLVVMSYCS